MRNALIFGGIAILVLLVAPLLGGAAEEPGDIDWKTTVPAASEDAKPEVLYFTAEWCPPCRAMKADSWPDDRVEKLLAEHYTPVYIDGDVNPQAMIDFGVQAYPTVLIRKNGEIVETAMGYRDADQLVELLEKHVYH